MKKPSAFAEKLMAGVRACGPGISGEKAALRLLKEQAPELGEDAHYDFIDGKGRLEGKKGALTFVYVPPPFEREITAGNGWLSPDGKFYPCRYHEHSELAGKIAPKANAYAERALEEEGYVKVQTMIPERTWFFHRLDLDGRGKPSDVQIRMVVDYCYKIGKPDSIPLWSET